MTKEPVGVVGAIAPWNVPLFIAAAKLAPSLAAGCTVVYKPAPETPFDAFRLAEIFTEAGLPKGVLSVIPAGREVGEHLVTHPGVDKISFTGSAVGGKRIGGLCGERLKRCTLELGGKSAAIILDDADLATTIPTLLPNAIMNNGQACIAQTRILAPRARYDEVVDAVVAGVGAMQVGDPLDPATEVGPVVAERQRAADRGLPRQRARGGRDRGPRRRPAGGLRFAKGWYVEPTVFTDVDNKMKIAQEEIFGPVLVVIPYDGDEQRRRHRQRLELRAVRLGLDGRQRPRPRRRPPGPHRHLHAQRAGAHRLRHAVRRVQGVRRRAASSAPRASRASSRRSRSPCRPGTRRASDADAATARPGASRGRGAPRSSGAG